MINTGTPSILVQDMSSPTRSSVSFSPEASPELSRGRRTPSNPHNHHNTLEGRQPEQKEIDILSSMDGSLFENVDTLSGAGVFSPVTSRPPSPTITRRRLPRDSAGRLSADLDKVDEGLSMRKIDDGLTMRKRKTSGFEPNGE